MSSIYYGHGFRHYKLKEEKGYREIPEDLQPLLKA